VSRIEAYKFGEIVIDGVTYHKDVIICDEGVIGGWWRVRGHSLAVEDLAPILADPPQALVIGQGAYGRMTVPQQTLRELEQVGMEVIVLGTAEACELYNQLSEEKRVFAALHLTC
jgi:hypothetical protein